MERVAALVNAADDSNGYNVEQRRRLLRGLEESLSDKGFQQTTIGDIVARARTSRRTFYANFESREQCLLALHAEADREQAAQIAAAVDSTAAWQTQVAQATEAWISFAESRPAIMVSWSRDIPALGQTLSGKLQRESTETFVALIQRLASGARGIAPVSRSRAIVLLGGLEKLTVLTLEDGQPMSSVRREAVEASIALLQSSIGRFEYATQREQLRNQ